MLTAGLAKVGFRFLGFLKIEMWKSPQCGFFIFSQFFLRKLSLSCFSSYNNNHRFTANIQVNLH